MYIRFSVIFMYFDFPGQFEEFEHFLLILYRSRRKSQVCFLLLLLYYYKKQSIQHFNIDLQIKTIYRVQTLIKIQPRINCYQNIISFTLTVL